MAQLTRRLQLPTLVSLKCMMVVGTGMRSTCRVSVGGKTQFTCVDGPFFDGHAVDFDEARRHQVKPDERKYHIATNDGSHRCNLARAVEETLQAESAATGEGGKTARQKPAEQGPAAAGRKLR